MQKANAASMTPEILTDRLRLRAWLPTDRAPFATLNADPRVMEHFLSTLSREQSDALATEFEETFDRNGFGFWAVEVPGLAAFAGFIGFSVPRFQAHFTPCVEIGWRLSADCWGRGYATEGASAALRFGFDTLQLGEIVATTTPRNVRSRRVMEKLGMVRNPADDFDHPLVPEGHPLRRHVLYRLGTSRGAHEALAAARGWRDSSISGIEMV
jgi:RimJ/RimL family protein N-acetyltransferase